MDFLIDLKLAEALLEEHNNLIIGYKSGEIELIIQYYFHCFKKHLQNKLMMFDWYHEKIVGAQHTRCDKNIRYYSS